MTGPPPLTLYAHLPWCVRKCPYCDFNSHTAGSAPPLERYVDALVIDLEAEAVRAGRRPIGSVFLGGGTPSLFPAGQIERLLAAVGQTFVVADDAEVTMEVNPGAIEHDDLAGYRAAGVNRLSIGAQSFSPDSLRALGRIHTVAEIGQCVAAARGAGFDNVNLDLMHGLPGQDAAGACRDLEAALSLRPEHLSWYELTLEPNTVFHARPPAGLPDEDSAAAIRDAGAKLLARAGFEQYEVSAWARPGRRCRHNLNYWRFGDYLGIGAGAHGKLTTGECILRSVKPAHPLEYMRRMEQGDCPTPEVVAPADRLFEFMLNALRLNEGFDEAGVTRLTGLPRDAVRPRLEALSGRGLLTEFASGRWRPSDLGYRFLNDLQAEFLP